MNPDALAEALLSVVAPLAEARRPGSSEGLTAADFVLERPKNRDHGDWASNAAMKLAKNVGTNPREFAGEIAAALAETPGVASVDVAGPGFINIRLDAAAAGALAKTIVDAGTDMVLLPSERSLAKVALSPLRSCRRCTGCFCPCCTGCGWRRPNRCTGCASTG